ncbi:MAG: GNAT family N-acetyltransferase [Bacteroidales bacterium]|nr:GNAT family N-acetyltransferase [Bacteroidales bacterium]
MIKYLAHNEINKRSWDECVKASVNGRLYAYAWYLDIVCDHWEGLVLDDYRAVFPLPYRKKFGLNYIYQPVFTQQLGLFSKVPISPQLLEDFLNQIPSKYKYVNLNLNQHNRPKYLKSKPEKRRNIEMDLLDEYGHLKEKYSVNLKRNLKKAEKSKLTIFENLKPDAVIQLFKANKGKTLKPFSEDDYVRLIRLVYKAIQQGNAEVWGVYTSENNLCAGGIFLQSHKRITFLFSGANDEAKQLAALPYMLDAFIEAHAGRELVFDFEGSNNEQLARFYLGFGSKPISYYQIKWIRASFFFKPVIQAYLLTR